MRENPLRVTVAVLVLSFAVLASTQDAESGNGIARAELVDTVSGDRIVETVQDLESFGTRAFYLNSSDNVSSYIYERFLQLGLDVEYQEFTVGSHVCRNVIATKLGPDESEGLLLFGGHYDSSNEMATTYQLGESIPAPGADDDASGVASVVELATIVSGIELRGTVKFVAFGAEELRYDGLGGLRGSAAFVAYEKTRGAIYRGAMVLDMIGYQGESAKHTVLVVNDDPNPLVSATENSVSKYGLDLDVVVHENSTVTFSDHYSFWKAGYPCALAIETMPGGTVEYEFNPYYHTTGDTSGLVSEGQLVEITKALVGAVLELDGDGDSGFPVTLVIGIIFIVSVAIAIYLYATRRRA